MKILVTGNAGSGKSTVAKEIARQHNLPYYSLDKIVWKPGWEQTSKKERDAKIKQLIKKQNWVIDGVSFTVQDAADKVIFLDYRRRTCYYRAFKRNLPFLFKSRPELPPNCPEILIIPTLTKIIWRFPKTIRPRILQEADSRKDDFLIVQANAKLEEYLKGLENPDKVQKSASTK